MLGLTIVSSSCTVNELNEQELPAGEYVRLSLTGGDGSTAPAEDTRATWEDPDGKGSLGFKWEAVAIDSEETEKLTMIVSNGTKALANQAAPEAGTPESELTHTGVAVTTGDDPHLAAFETVTTILPGNGVTVQKGQNAGWTVHIPSCAKPSDSDGNPGSSYARQEKKDQSEGAILNVYENHIDVLGVDFISGKYLPIATYRLDTTLEEVEETPIDETVLTADKFTWYKGTGEMSITDVEGMPGYIDVIFTGNGQGYYVKNNTFTEGHDSDSQVFDLSFEYLQCWTGWGTSSQTEVATIGRVGFYSGDYNLANTLNCYVDPVKGVQFQTKSNCNADFPIKLRMKARGRYYLKDGNAES